MGRARNQRGAVLVAIVAIGAASASCEAGRFDAQPPPLGDTTPQADGGADGAGAGVDSAPPLVGPVSGVVLDYFKQPYPGVSIVFDGKPYTSDVLGRFFLPPAPQRYQVVFVTDQVVVEYVGLTSRSPIVCLSQDGLRASPHNAKLHFARSQLAGTDVSQVVEISGSGVSNAVFPYTQSQTTYDYFVGWSGASTAHAQVWSLRYEADAATGLPTRYTETSLVEVAINDGDDLSAGPSYAPFAYGTGTLNVHATAPTGFTLDGVGVDVRVPSMRYGFGLQLQYRAASVDLAVPVPLLPGATVSVGAEARDGTGAVSAAGAPEQPAASPGPVTLDLPAAPALVAPPDGEVGVTPGVELVWTSPLGPVSEVRIHPGSRTQHLPGRYFYIVTDQSSATIPDLSPLGIAWPSGAEFAWYVNASTYSIEDWANYVYDPTRMTAAGDTPSRTFFTP